MSFPGLLIVPDMARKSATPVSSTPATLKKAGSASGQKNIQSFFSKTPTTASAIRLPERSSPRKTPAGKPNFNGTASRLALTPVPSSDAPVPEEDEDTKIDQTRDEPSSNAAGTPSRRVCMIS